MEPGTRVCAKKVVLGHAMDGFSTTRVNHGVRCARKPYSPWNSGVDVEDRDDHCLLLLPRLTIKSISYEIDNI